MKGPTVVAYMVDARGSAHTRPPLHPQAVPLLRWQVGSQRGTWGTWDPGIPPTAGGAHCVLGAAQEGQLQSDLAWRPGGAILREEHIAGLQHVNCINTASYVTHLTKPFHVQLRLMCGVPVLADYCTGAIAVVTAGRCLRAWAGAAQARPSGGRRLDSDNRQGLRS